MVATGDKTERVYEHVVARHLRGEYAPGDKLVIARLAEATGVSAVPVREALRRLEADGIVEYTHQRGFRARSLDPDEVVEALEAHGAIEAVAVALAVPRLGPEVVVGLREANALMRTAVADGDEAGFAEASLAFHRRLISACPNRYIRQALEQPGLRGAALRAAAVVLTPERSERVLAEHDEVIAALEAGADPEAIARMVSRHRAANVAAYRLVAVRS